SCSRIGACGAILRAFLLGSLLLFAGQTSTQRVHPLQSFGEVCSTYRKRSRSFQRATEDLNVSGADANNSGSHSFERITACGHTRTHLPHWMHNSCSHTGISCARFRFSHLEVPVGYVPSSGRALTGRSSPAPAIMGASTWRTNWGASSATTARRSNSLDTASGTLTSCKCARA